jgi:hypothetical protein
MDYTRQRSPHGGIAISQVACDRRRYFLVTTVCSMCVIETETGSKTHLLIEPVGYGMGNGRFTIPCSAE